MWIIITIFSAFLLGIYEILKKVSVRENAVLPVLLFSTMTAFLIFIPFILLSFISPETAQEYDIFVPFSGLKVQFLIFIKTIIVLSSWIFSFFALKHLPITFVSPIKSTGPVWTLLGAIVIFGEKFSLMQWIGIVITIGAFILFSLMGKREGIYLRKNKWFLFVILATLLNSVSGIYDKFLLVRYDRIEVQAWFSVYQFLVMTLVVYFLWYPTKSKTTPFRWRWSIPLVGITLILADYLYFYALSMPESLLGIVSVIRRTNVVISFIAGIFLFREKNIATKLLLLLLILTGVTITYLGS